MGAPETVVERTHFYVGTDGTFVLDGGDVPATYVRGMSVHLQNDSNTDLVLDVQDSADGVTWAILPFSNHLAAGLLTLDVVSKSEHAILLETGRRYLRFRVAPAPDAGNVFFSCYQCIPRGPLAPEGS